MDNEPPPSLGPPDRGSHSISQVNGSAPRRPQTLMSPVDRKLVSPPQNLTLTVHKDSGGYGMKVSGDNPVYVESVKPGGAAQRAGLLEGDMILKVNGNNVRSSTHTNVVQLIKSSATVELTVQRNFKMQRPSSVSVGPSTPLSQRGGITGPKPVDSATSHEMKLSKIQTLRLYLDKEKKNLENLSAANGNRQDRIRAEQTIRTLEEQLQLLCGEDPNLHLFTTIQSPVQLPAPPSTPAFLSRFPRSLSSLSLGTKKKSTEKETPITTPTTALSPNSSFNVERLSPSTPINPMATPTKKKFSGSQRDLKAADIPPPLPQRNIPRKMPTADGADSFGNDVVLRRSLQVSDLDSSRPHSSNSGGSSGNISINNNSNNNNNSPSNRGSPSSSSGGKGKQRQKQKIKALSDPKMSSQMLIDMEQSGVTTESPNTKYNEAPPLPPRQPGMLEEKQNFLNNNKFGNIEGRPLPNSLATHMNYPLIATCTAVRDNISAFPLSHRPNIVQQLQQNYNNQHHLTSLPSSATTTITSSISKSTALGLTPEQLNQLNNAQSRRVISSPEQYHQELPDGTSVDRPNQSHFPTWENFEKSDDGPPRPPGTPPPFYDESMSDSIFETSSPVNTSNVNNVSQPRQIISMEDDEMPDDQDSINEDHGPFRSFHQLLEHENLAYLAVFLNFVLSNSNPSPLLFYLITSLYKEGTAKDMRKWAYEIHSTFLVPRAPLLWCDVDENMLREVDDVLQKEYNKVEILRKLFWSSRRKAKEHITQQLNEFQVKRTAGLGTMYGPSDQVLMEAQGDKAKEQKVFEETLMPKIQQLVDEVEKDAPTECPKKSALSSALSTVLHRIFITRPNPGSPIDRVHHFVSREKSFKSRIMGKHRKAMVRGHHLVLQQYYEVTHCNHCQNIIWGVSPQGYHCTDCELNIHRACSKVLEENCPGPAPSKQKAQNTDNKMSKFMEKIRPTNYFIQTERSRRQDEDAPAEEFIPMERPIGTSVVRQPSDRRPDATFNSITGQNSNDIIQLQPTEMGHSAQDADVEIRDSSKSKSAPVSVNRSESYKERLSHRRNRNNRRKTSDPSLSKTNDEHGELGGISNANYTASSSSSLSSSLDSPSTSLEVVGVQQTIQGPLPTPREWVDSDDETGDLEADWSSNVASDILQALSDGEKKRQEIINEIYQTERNHVRTLRLLEGIFMRPLQESGALNADHLNLLFPPALLTLKDHHNSFEHALKQRRIDHGPLIDSVGDLLLSMFDGHSGENLREYAAQFCARQQIALEALKEKRRKDENLQRLLTKAESHKACRRLQLKDLLPTALQRLTKYPLLFESLHKITVRVMPENEVEAQAIKVALDASRRILDHVNQAVRYAEDTHKLQAIQRKLDKASYEKEGPSEFKNLDLTQHRLIHDGPLIMKKNPGVQLHGLLFENMMVLLQKQDDKYILKYHSNPGAGSGEGKIIEGRFNPITKVNLIFVRPSAVDKNTFFLINTNVSQMLELTAPSSSECKTWFKHISDAAESYKFRTKTNQESVEDPASVTLPAQPAKETVETTPDKDAVVSASSHPTDVTNNVNNNVLTPSLEKNNNNNISYRKDDEEDVDNKRTPNDDDQSIDEQDEQQDQEDDDTTTTTTTATTARVDNKQSSTEYSNNLNKTRTLTQQSSLVAPSEVQINLSSALTAEPVLTPCERLRRLDDLIRATLAEKQKIVCDMFRIPNEHFTAIADIVGQPEAPNEPSEIVLAAFAQIQSLTETLNDYIKVSTHQEISAVSTSLCDECLKQNQDNRYPIKKKLEPNTLSSISNIQAATVTASITSSPSISSSLTATTVKCDTAIIDRLEPITDDDGYCEIDEIRLPSLTTTTSSTTTTTPITPITSVPTLTAANVACSTEIKRLSTISADSIPEETEQEINVEMFETAINSECETETLSNQIREGIEHIEINETYDTSCQQLSEFSQDNDSIKEQISYDGVNPFSESCAVNRLAHATSIAPSVPCHLISSHVTALSMQISQLLPKLCERDIEREKLRKENQHLRELLNSMHERVRVLNELEIPAHASETDISSNNAEQHND